MKQVFRKLNITFFFISFDCTSFIQVLNVAINKSLKNRISELIDIHYDQHFDQ
jgi:hypothetical protein